jgi:hypothetical protein
MTKNPRGGTELQFEYLRKYVDSKLLDQVQITTSVPEKIPLAKDKLNILWQKNSYDQPNLAPWFSDPKNHKNMIGMYLILIGIMKNLEWHLKYQQKNV